MRNKKFHFIVFIVFNLLILAIVGIALIRPYLFDRILWHSEKAVRSVVQHEKKVMDIPLIAQTKNLNCEAATATMILNYLGKDVTIDDVQNALPLNDNPNKGFRGDVDGSIWGFDDYGVHAEPIAQVMTKLGVPSKAYTNISEEFLKQKIMQGKPAIVWISISNPNSEVKIFNIDGEKVKMISGEHVAVVTGYDNGGWILNDPWSQTSEDGKPVAKQLIVDNLDEIMWDDFDHMTVIVE